MKTTREKSYIDRVKKSYKSLLKEIFDKHMKHVEIEPYTFSAEVDTKNKTVKIVNPGRGKPLVVKGTIKTKPKKKGAKV